MNLRVEQSISRIAEQARGRFATALETARSRTEKAADQVTGGKKPVKTLSKLSLKLTAVTHRTADKVLKQQTKMLENQIDAFAGRLSAAAEATDVRNLVETQFRMIPENASLFVSDARSALGIVAGAGAEIRNLVQGTLTELRRSRKSPARQATDVKSATPPQKKIRKKTAAAKTRSAKAQPKAA